MGSSSSRHRPHGDQQQQQFHPPHVMHHHPPPQPQQYAYVQAPVQGPQQTTQYLSQGYVGMHGYTTAGAGGYTPNPFTQQPYYQGHMLQHPPAGPYTTIPYGMQPINPWGGAPAAHLHHGHQGHHAAPARMPQTHEYQSTDKVRNQANLNKKSLKLVAVEGRPGQYQLQFAFDASAPCRVTTFVLGGEDPRQGCAITTPASRVRQPVPYQQPGMGLVFPPSPEVAEAHSLNTGALAPDALAAPRGDTYPLIIRLESLTPEGGRDGHSLEELPVGCALPLWVQAQTTYAQVKQEGGGKLSVEVIKQKIWVKGVAYEMQDIYGMKESRVSATASPDPAAAEVRGGGLKEDDVDGRECVICLTNERDTMVLPCRHLCMCAECATALKTQSVKCPVCRVEIESLMHFKRYEGPPLPAGGGGSSGMGQVAAR